MPLTNLQAERYSRNIILGPIGVEGQEKLLASKVLVIGTGGLGSAATLYLAAAGVGTLGLVDCDQVDLSNLQRQILHGTKDVGRRKVDSARDRVLGVNPDVNVRAYPIRACSDNIREIMRGYDFLIDATDNFPAKFLVNDACFFERIPYSHAGILAFEGQLMTVLPAETTCYRCIFPTPPATASLPSRVPQGVLGVLPGVIGSLQATEAIKYLLGLGDLLTDSLLVYSALTMEFRRIPRKRRPDCPLCGSQATITELRDEQAAPPGQDGPR